MDLVELLDMELLPELALPLRAEVDAVAAGEGFPVSGFRLMVALASCALVAPVLHLLPSGAARKLLTVSCCSGARLLTGKTCRPRVQRPRGALRRPVRL